MAKFKKFKLGDVFVWQPQKEIDPLKIKDLKTNEERKYPFYGQATINNGIIDYLNLDESVLNNKSGNPTILIHSNNQNIVYLETPFYLKDGHGATSVLQNKHLNEYNALYIISCIKKVITEKFTYNEKATKVALKNTNINLPVNDLGEIDYKYMEEYIIKLKKNIINNVSKYLDDNSLNTSLSDAERKAVDDYENNRIKYKSFKFDDIFYSISGDTDIQQKNINGKGYLVISSGEKNNGIIGKTDVKAKIIDSNTITVDMFGYVKFRDFKYKMVTHARVFALKFKNKELSVEEGLYIVAHMAFLKEIFSYSDMASWEKLKNREIILPVKNDLIDLDYMNNIVKAKQKFVLNNLSI